MSTIFTKIINEDIPCYKIDETDKFIAFLDINPLVKGHTLVVPKVEVDYIFDLENELLSELILFSKSVAKKIKKAIPCDRVGVSVVGLEVPHAHVHLIPINQINDMNFSDPTLQAFQAVTEIQRFIVRNDQHINIATHGHPLFRRTFAGFPPTTTPSEIFFTTTARANATACAPTLTPGPTKTSPASHAPSPIKIGAVTNG